MSSTSGLSLVARAGGSVSFLFLQRFLQFELGYHGLPVAAGRLAVAGHVDRANRVCLACNCGANGWLFVCKHFLLAMKGIRLLP